MDVANCQSLVVGARPRHRPQDYAVGSNPTTILQFMFMSTPVWQRSRVWHREEDRDFARKIGFKLPILKQIALVELDAIMVPDWARKKAIKGLTITNSSVWLRRIAANFLCRLDREAGGTPRLTVTDYRRCNNCKRVLLGPDAQARFELDRKYEGQRITCGPDCAELQKSRRKRKVA